MDDLEFGTEPALGADLDIARDDLVHVVVGTLACHLPLPAARALARLLGDDLAELVLAAAEGVPEWNERSFVADLAETMELSTVEAARVAALVLAKVGLDLDEAHAIDAFFAALPASMRQQIRHRAPADNR